ncbi:hypothetical protein BC834DRAFT_975229 [Gloeopeniophorella convolvens]|nr:hypothetical protein BC834DRAFT_975229 [Gloeopeniophorella convolvens]
MAIPLLGTGQRVVLPPPPYSTAHLAGVTTRYFKTRDITSRHHSCHDALAAGAPPSFQALADLVTTPILKCKASTLCESVTTNIDSRYAVAAMNFTHKWRSDRARQRAPRYDAASQLYSGKRSSKDHTEGREPALLSYLTLPSPRRLARDTSIVNEALNAHLAALAWSSERSVIPTDEGGSPVLMAVLISPPPSCFHASSASFTSSGSAVCCLESPLRSSSDAELVIWE